MNPMDIAKTMLAKKLGGNNAAVGAALGSLLGKGDSMDLGSVVAGFKAKGMADKAESWLGDGANADVSADDLRKVLGEQDIKEAAAQMGTDEGTLLDGLKDALPQMVDKASTGGSLMDRFGGAAGLAGMAKKFL